MPLLDMAALTLEQRELIAQDRADLLARVYQEPARADLPKRWMRLLELWAREVPA